MEGKTKTVMVRATVTFPVGCAMRSELEIVDVRPFDVF